MTLSVVATDGSGAVGIAITSSSPAVAARCIHLRAGVGGASSQNITDPRVGIDLLDSLEAGRVGRDAMDHVVCAREHVDYRQLTVLGLDGKGAAFTGSRALGVHHQLVGPDVVAAGNLLADTDVIDAMVDGFRATGGELEERLLAALEAGCARGGEAAPLRSAGLAVVHDVPWRVTDLRADWSDRPVEDLRALLDVWLPQRDDYLTRALDPSAAPPYCVPGDE